MNELIVGILLFYVAPFVISYLFMRHQYNTDMNVYDPTLGDLLILFIPVVNLLFTIFAIMHMIRKAVIKNNKDGVRKTLRRFFLLDRRD